MKNLGIAALVTAVILVAVGVVMTRGRSISGQDGETESAMVPIPTEDLVSTPSPDNELPEADVWQRYQSTIHGFSIEHPRTVEVTSQNDSRVTLIQWGPTQQPDTEFYDGISLQFDSGSLDGASLQDLVEEQREMAEAQPVTEFVSPLQSVSIGGRSGYGYRVVSMGERSHNFLPKGEGEYLEIINGTVDPENQGFESTVARMLASLEIENVTGGE